MTQPCTCAACIRQRENASKAGKAGSYADKVKAAKSAAVTRTRNFRKKLTKETRRIYKTDEARLEAVIPLRESGLTLGEIAWRFGVTTQRVHQIYRKAIWLRDESIKSWQHGLSLRAVNCLNRIGASSRIEAMAAFEAIQNDFKSKPPHYGRRTHLEIATWLGIDLPEEKSSRKKGLQPEVI